MFPKIHYTPACRLGAAVAVASLLSGAGIASAQGSSPFAGLMGSWTGNGAISMTDGSKENIRCRANYSVPPSGEKLHVELSCASDSYKVQIISNVVAAEDGSLSGVWRELTRQADGEVSGRVESGGQIQASLGGTGFGAQITISTRGNRQAVAIRSQGIDIQSVSIELRKV